MTNAKYMVNCFYGKDAKFPKIKNKEAISTWHTTLASAELEVEVAKSRKDIGKVILIDTELVRTGGLSMTVWLRNDSDDWCSVLS